VKNNTVPLYGIIDTEQNSSTATFLSFMKTPLLVLSLD